MQSRQEELAEYEKIKRVALMFHGAAMLGFEYDEACNILPTTLERKIGVQNYMQQLTISPIE